MPNGTGPAPLTSQPGGHSRPPGSRDMMQMQHCLHVAPITALNHAHCHWIHWNDFTLQVRRNLVWVLVRRCRRRSPLVLLTGRLSSNSRRSHSSNSRVACLSDPQGSLVHLCRQGHQCLALAGTQGPRSSSQACLAAHLWACVLDLQVSCSCVADRWLPSCRGCVACLLSIVALRCWPVCFVTTP